MSKRSFNIGVGVTLLLSSILMSCGMDKANEHLESMDKNTQRLNDNIAAYHQDVSGLSRSLETVATSLTSLQQMAQSMSTTFSSLLRPPSTTPEVELPSFGSPSTETGGHPPPAPACGDDAACYRRELARMALQMATFQQALSTLHQQLLLNPQNPTVPATAATEPPTGAHTP